VTVEIDMKSIPKLGSSKEALRLLGAALKEQAIWQGKVWKGRPRFIFQNFRKAGKVAGLSDLGLPGESAMALPDIVVGGEKFWGVIDFLMKQGTALSS